MKRRDQENIVGKQTPYMTPHTHKAELELRSSFGTDKTIAGFKFNFFGSLLKLASGIIFYLLNLSANLLFHTYKHC